MSVKGELLVDGATFFCSMSVANNSPATAVKFKVTSQKKYFAQEKLIGTTKDNKIANFGNNKGFGNCNNGSSNPPPCAVKATFKDYYKNVTLNKLEILIDKTTAVCTACGVKGDIKVVKTGQTKAVSQIDANEADPFEIANVSPHWESIINPKEPSSVSEVSMLSPLAVKPNLKQADVYYFIKEAKKPFSLSLEIETYLKLKATYKGDPNNIVWGLYKGEGIKDKVKTFVGVGANFNQSLDKMFENLEQGKYRIEAYVSNPNDPKCAFIIEYVKDQIESITTQGKTLVKNVPISLTLKYKIDAFVETTKVLNQKVLGFVNTAPIAMWRIKQGETVLHNSYSGIQSSLVDLVIGGTAIITFKNAGKYTVEAYTDPKAEKPFSVSFEVFEKYGINTVIATSNIVLRYTDMLKVGVGQFNVDFAPTKKAQWYLQKDGIWLKTFSDSATSKATTINRRIDQLLYNDAKGGNNYFGKYKLEAYANGVEAGASPKFSGTDTYTFEVIENQADILTLPKNIPKGAKVKYTASPRISPLVGDEKLQLELPESVVNNNDGTLTFTKDGEFEIASYMTGTYTNDKRAKVKVKVSSPAVETAMWAYGTGYKRTETGFKEETHGYVKIKGLENQTLAIKIWVKGENESIYSDASKKHLLEEKTLRLDDKGKGSFMITTNDDYKKKIELAIPATATNVNPTYRLVYTLELPTAGGEISLPDKFHIEHARPVEGTKLYELLEPNEELTLTNEKKIKSIVFSTEDGKDVQRTITHYNRTHKIWVHTVNMQDDVLKIDVLKEVSRDAMVAVDNIVFTHESKQTYKEEKVGADGLLEVSFTTNPDWAKPAQNVDFYIAQVSKKVKDPNDDKKEIFTILKTQITENNTVPATLAHDKEMEKMGIKAQKQDGTPFTLDEMVELRKKFMFYQSGALKVSQGVSVEAISNDNVPVVVEIGEINRENAVCACKENNFYWSGKITCEERKKVLEVCASLWGESKKVEKASELMSIFHLETGNKTPFSPSADNGKGYVGLVQFSEASAKSLGTTQAKLKAMTFIEQMDYVKKYLEKNKDKLTTLTDFYLQVIKPNAVGHGSEPDYIVFDESISVPDGDGSTTSYEQRMKNITQEPWVTKYGYASNGSFMLEEGEATKREKWVYTKQRKEMRPGFHNGKTTVKELTHVVTKQHYDLGKPEKFSGRCKNTSNLDLTGRAPWMKIVLEEAKTYGGYSEGGENKLNKRIKSEYFAIPNEATTSKSDPSEISWCAAFASWCLQKAGYANPSTCRALEFNTAYIHEGAGNVDKKLSKMRKIANPVYGCIVVWKNKSGGGGHVAFYYGKTSNGNIIPIGGNQGSSLQFSNRNPNGDYGQEVVGYFLPDDYKDNPADEFTEAELKLDPVLLNKSGLLAKNGTVSGDT